LRQLRLLLRRDLGHRPLDCAIVVLCQLVLRLQRTLTLRKAVARGCVRPQIAHHLLLRPALLLHLYHFLLRRVVYLVLVRTLPERLLLARLHLLHTFLHAFHLPFMLQAGTLACILSTHLLIHHAKIVELPGADSLGRLRPRDHGLLRLLGHRVVQADARLLLQLDAVVIAARGGTGHVLRARYVLRGGGSRAWRGDAELVRLVQRLLLRRDLLLDAATTRALGQAKVELGKCHPVQVLVLLGVLLIILHHRHVGAFGANVARQVHLAVQIAVDAGIDLNLLTAIYRNLVTSIFLLLSLHERQAALVRRCFVDVRSRRAHQFLLRASCTVVRGRPRHVLLLQLRGGDIGGIVVDGRAVVALLAQFRSRVSTHLLQAL
jgi:hypothetical protein